MDTERSNLHEVNPYAAPVVEAKAVERDPEGAWREGKLMVVTPNVELPDRCVKCNEPAAGRKLRQRLSWYSPVAYVGLLLGLLPLLVIILVTQRTMTIHVGVCAQHAARRRNAILLGWFFGFGALGALFTVAVLPLWAFLTLFVGAFVGLFWCALASRVVWAKRIERKRKKLDVAWVKGVSVDFLHELPTAAEVVLELESARA